jgi:hypothetical protein
MKGANHIVFIAAFIVLLQSCSTTRRFGTTIERDENNPCQVNIIIQVGIQGTDDDVAKIKSDLDACYNKECFIPCENNKEKGCKTKITTVVKKWSSLKDEEQIGFHYVQMIDNDGLPSNAYIGTPNKSTPESSCLWRRNAFPGTYCHEVLHLCGLYDKYCARLYDPVTDSVRTERNCDPPPDPDGGSCCVPNASFMRCTVPCSGHEGDIMGSSGAGLSCENITDVLKNAGFDKCPQECCSSNMTFTRPPDEVHITPGYLHFGDKSTKFGSIGISIGYTKYISSSIGATIDAGYYRHTDKDNNLKQTSGLFNITGGITWLPVNPSKTQSGFSVSTHVMAGISSYTQKSTYSGNSFSNNEISFHVNAGAALNWKLNQSLNIRLLQTDYAPTFFYNTTQSNFRVSAGLVYKIHWR